eukprot:s1264_g5.t2
MCRLQPGFVCAALLAAPHRAEDIDWDVAACPPMPAEPALSVETLQCIYSFQRLPLNFYIRKWYQPMEDLVHRAARCLPGPAPQRVLQLMDALDRVLCFVKMESCFEEGPRREQAGKHVCAKMDATGMFSCASLLEDTDRVPLDVFNYLEESLAGCPEKDDPLWSILQQLPGLGTLWSLGAALHPRACQEERTPSTKFSFDGILANMRLISGCIWEGGDHDLATRLLCHGFQGVLLEGHPQRLAMLKDFFGDRSDLVLLSQIAEPSSVAAMFEDATWNNRALRNTEVDLLQITLGCSDCSFLSALLKNGVRPRFLRIIFWHVIPPPLRYQPGSHRPLGDWYEDVMHLTGEACSLQAVAEAAQEDYELWFLDPRDCDKAIFARRDVAKELGLSIASDLSAAWRQRYAGGECWLNGHIFDALMVDPRPMLDERVPPEEKRLMLKAHLAAARRTEDITIAPEKNGV